jgi:asparagine synthase (glutamine-hydrolysing)
MCGICGIVSFNGTKVDRDLLVRMRDVLEHRGPDDCGAYYTPNSQVGLGSRRLSIIDLSEAGRMPIHNEDNTLHIVYNGEVYNANRDLRSGLEARQHRFVSHTDTEVILHLFEEQGPAALQQLRGMFAIAIWDDNKQQLFLARDRVGIKPLYYTFHNGQLRFASEIKSLLQDPTIPRKLCKEALYHYLSFITIPAPLTLFEGIYKLPAGHFAVVNSEGQIHIEQYWDVFQNVKPQTNTATLQDELLALLYEATELRMISDVPFGALLSGGIDSSTNVALMSQILKQPVRTYAIGWRDMPQYNEFEYAKFVADRYKTEHYATEIGEEELINFIPDLVYYQDEPIADPVCVPVYYVCKLARESGTTVLQVGEGSDEQFAYPYWLEDIRRAEIVNQLRLVPGNIKNLGYQIAQRFSGSLRSARYEEFMRRVVQGEPTFWGGNDIFTAAEKSRYLSSDFMKSLDGLSTYEAVVEPLYQKFKTSSPLNTDQLGWMGYMDFKIRLPELLLMRVDKMSMATSIEARVPFLDHKFVEFSMGIPQHLKIGDKKREAKQILKRAVDGLVPHEIVYRKKVGFGAPTSDFLDKELGKLAQVKLTGFAERTGIFKPAEMAEFARTGGWRVWFILNFVLWHELWIEGKTKESLIQVA